MGSDYIDLAPGRWRRGGLTLNTKTGPSPAMLPDLPPQDELLIAVALHGYAREWASAEPRNAERAWELCVAICESHGLDPAEAVLRLK